MVARYLFSACRGEHGTGPASAERLVASLSTIAFCHTELRRRRAGPVRDRGTRRPGDTTAAAYGLVVTVWGPRETLVIRRKERMARHWVNTDSREFVGCRPIWRC